MTRLVLALLAFVELCACHRAATSPTVDAPKFCASKFGQPCPDARGVDAEK